MRRSILEAMASLTSARIAPGRLTVALEKFENPTALAKRLEDILVRGSLYRVFAYIGSDCHLTNTGAMGTHVMASCRSD